MDSTVVLNILRPRNLHRDIAKDAKMAMMTLHRVAIEHTMRLLTK